MNTWLNPIGQNHYTGRFKLEYSNNPDNVYDTVPITDDSGVGKVNSIINLNPKTDCRVSLVSDRYLLTRSLGYFNEAQEK